MHSLFHKYIGTHGRCDLVVIKDTFWICTNVRLSRGLLVYTERFPFNTLEAAVKCFRKWDGTIFQIGATRVLTGGTKVAKPLKVV